SFIFSAFKMMTWSPLIRKGAYCGLCFPLRMVAAFVATRPSTWSAASITYHLSIADNSSAVKNRVDMLSSLQQVVRKVLIVYEPIHHVKPLSTHYHAFNVI